METNVNESKSICPSWNSSAWFRCFMGVSSSDPENHIELLPNQNAKFIDV